MKALIFTKRSELPAAIQSLVRLLSLEKKIVKRTPKVEEIENLIRVQKPTFIMIDGDFNPGDHSVLQAMSGLEDEVVRRRFVQTELLPESVRLIPRIQAARKNVKKFPMVWFFMDSPAPIVSEQLRNLGTVSVISSLEKATEGQITAELLKARGQEAITQGGKLINSVAKLGKTIGDRLQTHLDKDTRTRVQ